MKTLLSIEKATAKTVATGNIIPYLIFRFHEEVSICRFHELSHTFATLALENGMDVKTLSAMLGHVSAATTLDIYTHVTPDMQKAASGIVGGFMEDLLGKGLRPWQRNGKAELAP